MSMSDDREIALETVKMWMKEKDAAYLAKENRIFYWIGYHPETKNGEWASLTLKEAVRVIRATRAGFGAMKLINSELVMLAAQEEDRAFTQGISSRSKAPSEYFNFNKSASFNNYELLVLCLIQACVGRGWNMEAVLFGDLVKHLFAIKGYAEPNRTLRWKLIRAVADEAGIMIRDRKDRLTVYGVGRFVALQIHGLNDSIRTELSQEEIDSLTSEVILKLSSQ